MAAAEMVAGHFMMMFLQQVLCAMSQHFGDVFVCHMTGAVPAAPAITCMSDAVLCCDTSLYQLSYGLPS